MTNENILAAIDPKGYVHYALTTSSDVEHGDGPTGYVSFHVDAEGNRFLAGADGNPVDIIDPETTLPRPRVELKNGGYATLLDLATAIAERLMSPETIKEVLAA